MSQGTADTRLRRRLEDLRMELEELKRQQRAADELLEHMLKDLKAAVARNARSQLSR